MKKYLSIIAVALFAFACAKETPLTESPAGKTANPEEVTNKEQKDQEDPSQTVHELFVSIASVEDPETKAAISNTDGAFTWTAGDDIAVVSGKNVYRFTAEDGGSDAVRFTYTGEITGTPTDIYYPYDEDSSSKYLTAPPTSVSGLEGALSGTNLRLHGTIVGSSATLSHTIALLKVTFTNVPTFANSISFDGNVNDVTITDIGDASTISAYIPVNASTTSFTVSLLDANSNAIISKSTSGKSFTAGTLKKMKSLPAGWTFTFTGGSGKVDNIKLFVTDGNTISWNDEKTREFGLSPTTSGSNVSFFLPANNKVVTSGRAVCLEAYLSSTKLSTSECLYLYRDFTFDFSGKSLKTDYRIYPRSTDKTSAPVYVFYQPYKIYVKNHGGGDIVLHTWNTGETKVEDISTYATGDGYCIFTLSRFWKDQTCNFGFKHSDGTNWGGNKSVTFKDDYQCAYLDYKGQNDTEWLIGTDYNNKISAIVLNGDWPGNTISPLKANISSETFITIGSAYYGQEVSFKFNSGDTEWYPIINRDYDYSF